MPAVHQEHDGERTQVPVAVYRVQVVHAVRHLRERRQASLLRRLRPWIPHVLPCPSDEGTVVQCTVCKPYIQYDIQGNVLKVYCMIFYS